LEGSYGGDNDQVGRCCYCFGRRNFRPGHVARAASSTGRHDHASPPSPPTPTVQIQRPWSGTNMGLSTMRGKWHLHVCVTSPDPPPGQPQVLRIRLRYRTEPGGHNKGQGSNKGLSRVSPIQLAGTLDPSSMPSSRAGASLRVVLRSCTGSRRSMRTQTDQCPMKSRQ
jgi:hypothetical protein